MKRCLLICLCLLALPFAAAAQIFTQGSDPGNLRWWRIDTPNYRIIYPEGTDSLARIYAMDLERLREATGRSIGMVPGESRWKKRTPVILHTHSDFSNGSMFCAPYRMDLFTRPDPYGGDPTPWELSLTAHEPRHQTLITGKLSCFFAESRPVLGITAMRNKIRSMHIFTPSGYILYYLIFFSYNRH